MEDGDDVRRRHQPPQQLTFEIADASDGGGGGGAGHDSDGSSVGGTQNQFAGAHLPDLGKLSGEESDTAADLQAEYEDATQDLVCCGRFPKAVPFLIGQEFCERFSYYGLRAILGKQIFRTCAGSTEFEAGGGEGGVQVLGRPSGGRARGQ